MNQLETDLQIVGISTVTSNEAAFKQNSIGKLWDEFLKNPIKEKLSAISSPSIFAVYSDYEEGYQGKYKITIGYSVKESKEIPNGLTMTTIPAGKYKIFKSKSSSPEDIIDTWKTIWQIDPTIFQPNFVTMFEEYKDNNEVVIHVGYE